MSQGGHISLSQLRINHNNGHPGGHRDRRWVPIDTQSGVKQNNSERKDQQVRLTFKHNIESVLPFVRSSSVKISKCVLKDTFTVDVNGQVLASHSLGQSVKLLPEISPLNIEIQNLRVVYEDRERTVGKMRRRLAQNLIQNSSVCF